MREKLSKINRKISGKAAPSKALPSACTGQSCGAAGPFKGEFPSAPVRTNDTSENKDSDGGTTGKIPKGNDMPATKLDGFLRQLSNAYQHQEETDSRPTKSIGKKKITFVSHDKKVDRIKVETTCTGVVNPESSACLETVVERKQRSLCGLYNSVLYSWTDIGLSTNIGEVVEYYDGLDTVNLPYGKYQLFHSVYLKSFVNFSTHYKVDRIVTYCHPLYRYMQGLMPLPAPEARNRDALLRDVLKKYPSVCLVNNSLVIDTLLVYMYDLLCKGQRITTVSDVVDCTVCATNILGVVNTGSRRLQEIPPSDCLFANDWGFNCRVNVVQSKGFDFDYNNTVITKYPTFKISHGDKPQLIHSAFCRISGIQPFQYYEMNGFNVTPALSRIMKARPLENELTQNQLGYLSLDIERSKKLMRAVGGDYEFEEDKGRVTFKPWRYSSYAKKEVRSVETSDPSLASRELHLHLMKVNQMRLWDRFTDYVKSFGMMLYYSAVLRVVVGLTSLLVDAVYTPFYYMYDKLEHLGFVTYLPAPKRTLYQRWYNDDAKVHNILNNLATPEVKIKAEAGKFNKAPRLYGGFEEGCLVDKIAPEVFKHMCKDEIPMHYLLPNEKGLAFTIVFSNDQAADASDRMFQSLSCRPPGIYCVYFSDDGFVFAVNKDLSTSIYETDISGCDASNGVAIFMLLHSIIERLSGVESADALVSQCSRGFKLLNPSCRDEYVKMDLLTYFEYSGSVLTTALNNIASMFIFCEAYQCILDGVEDIGEALVKGATRGGWTVTCDKRDDLNDVSFLKRSYNGSYSYLNFGCILRSLGIIRGVATAEKFGLTPSEYKTFSDAELFEIHLKQRVDSLVNEPASDLTNALRCRVGYPTQHVLISYEDLHKRYRFTEIDYVSLCLSLEKLKFGDCISCPACHAIMRKDYGVG